MSAKEQEELNEILAAAEEEPEEESLDYDDDDDCYYVEEREEDPPVSSAKDIQWSTADDIVFYPCPKSIKKLKPDVYHIGFNVSAGTSYFRKVSISTEDLIQFPGTNSEEILKEIKDFWSLKDNFNTYELSFKRGILLWGPPGGGKTSIVRLLIKDVIKRKGVCFLFDNPDSFKRGFFKFREIQKNTPVIAILEDIDSILEDYSETEVLKILDGVEKVDNIVFVATTNYPEKLGARIINRPSRFDKRFKVDYPSIKAKKIYLEHLMKKKKSDKVNVEQWAKDTEQFTFAHLKELFISVVILDNDYSEALQNLKIMVKQKVSSEADRSSGKVGFNK